MSEAGGRPPHHGKRDMLSHSWIRRLMVPELEQAYVALMEDLEMATSLQHIVRRRQQEHNEDGEDGKA